MGSVLQQCGENKSRLFVWLLSGKCEQRNVFFAQCDRAARGLRGQGSGPDSGLKLDVLICDPIFTPADARAQVRVGFNFTEGFQKKKMDEGPVVYNVHCTSARTPCSLG